MWCPSTGFWCYQLVFSETHPGFFCRWFSANGCLLGAQWRPLPALLCVTTGLRVLRRCADRQREEALDGPGPLRYLRYTGSDFFLGGGVSAILDGNYYYFFLLMNFLQVLKLFCHIATMRELCPSYLLKGTWELPETKCSAELGKCCSVCFVLFRLNNMNLWANIHTTWLNPYN